MNLGNVLHQKSGKPERVVAGKGEAQADATRDETRPAFHKQEGLGREDLLAQALSRENMARAWKRVKANKGSAGVDGLTIEQTAEFLKTHWTRIRSELLSETYRPQAVRRVEIPKPAGGTRELGIPTVVDRLIQQALLQSMAQVAEQLQACMPGWKAYFRLAQTPQTFKDLDSWLRHRLRAIQLKYWRRGSTIYRGLRKLGASHELALQTAGGGGRWWSHSGSALNKVLTVSYFDSIGIPKLT